MLGPISWPYAIWLAIVAAQRLLELRLSRANVRASARGRAAQSELAWRTMVALHVALIALPPAEIALLHRRPPAWVFASALVVFGLAQVLRAWSIRTLGRAWNARAIVDTSRPVVDTGPYRWIRHPNYLAVILEFISIPIGGGAWISVIVLNALHVPVLVQRIRAEERLLAEMPGWTERMETKPRLIPGARAPSRS